MSVWYKMWERGVITSLMMAASLHSHGQLLDLDVNFPVIAAFNESTKLPTYKSVIGVL